MTINNKALRELEEVATCFAAVSDLMCPDAEFQQTQRDRISVLLAYLSQRQQTLLGSLCRPAESLRAA